jgi:hypothetical protein
MKNATCEPFKLSETRYRIAARFPTWNKKGERPQNATIPPFDDDYAELEHHMYVQFELSKRPGVVPERAKKSLPLGRKSGAEPGWLPADELTREWLQYVEEYRRECDTADRKRLQNDEEHREATS